MSRAPRVTGEELIRALSKVGFEVVRQRGSHRFLRHSDGRSTTVPIHRGEIVGPGLMSKIIRDIELDRSVLLQLLDG